MLALDLSPQVFTILSAFIAERVGITYSSCDRDLLREKVSGRALELGFQSLLDYYYYLRYDPAGSDELHELTEALVVNETYFFREWPAIRTLVDAFILPRTREGLKLRVWSAACATGEEPLSLAMALDAAGILDKVEIVASDVSQRVLAKARLGRFGRRSVRQVPEPSLLERFITSRDDHYEVAPHLLAKITWCKANLLAPAELEPLGSFDIILCRNVLIYFSDQTIRAVLSHLANRLRPDGALFVGVSESLIRYSGHFAGEECGGTFVYRKAARFI